jgi:hypothetical protein
MNAVHFNFDSAWPEGAISLPCLDLADWGPRLRYLAPSGLVEAFYARVKTQLADFTLFGSGDFHYLTALWLRRQREPVTVVSFDNHPDWDLRPPRWACGGWVNRALELPAVRRVAVWGCGNFELAWPARLFANTRALRSRQLEVHAWAERQSPATQQRFPCVTRENWRERFTQFMQSIAGENVYVTLDLDCLAPETFITNWENGLFTPDDLVWALGEIRRSARLIGGDLCGAYSPPVYDRWTQRFAGDWDHPKLSPVDTAAARRINSAVLARIWPALAG